MKDFQKRLDEIVEKISYIESNRMKIGSFLREINDKLKIGPDEEVSDVRLINKITPEKLSLSVLGIDGSIVKHSYHGLDLMLMRALGVKFDYSEKGLDKVVYYPDTNPSPIPKIIVDSFSDFELISCYNFERQIMEINTTIEAASELNPDIIFLDGSIIPQYTQKPDNPVLREYYNQSIKAYESLFEFSRNTGTMLAGIIKDSRGIKFCDIIIRKVLKQLDTKIIKELRLILEKTKDTNLLYYTLNKDERTCVFNYSQNPSVHPLLKEFEKMSDRLFSFYIKTVEFDRPLRVDFISFENELEVADKVSSILLETSGHSGYGLPAVLIEADQRVRLSEKDLDMFYADLVNKIGNVSGLFRLRREMRPF